MRGAISSRWMTYISAWLFAALAARAAYDIDTFAGTPGAQGTSDGTVATVRFYHPRAIAVDASGNAYVADTLNHTVRKMSATGVVTTLAGLAGNSFCAPTER